jgi:hypothetical protein
LIVECFTVGFAELVLDWYAEGVNNTKHHTNKKRKSKTKGRTCEKRMIGGVKLITENMVNEKGMRIGNKEQQIFVDSVINPLLVGCCSLPVFATVGGSFSKISINNHPSIIIK